MSTFAPRLAPLSKCSISWTAPGFSRLFKGPGLMVTGNKMLFPWEPAAPVTSSWTLRPRASRLQSGPQFRNVLFSSMWKRPEVYDLCQIWNISKYIKAQCLLIVSRTAPRGRLGPPARGPGFSVSSCKLLHVFCSQMFAVIRAFCTEKV